MTQGIYLIKNNINGKCYVGQSKNIEARWAEHKRLVKSNKPIKNTYPLYCAFIKYGIANFTFSILETVKDHALLNATENKYIAKYDTVAKGYNQIYTSRNGLSKEELNKRRYEKYGVTKETLFNQLTENTFEHVASIYEVSSNTIRKWCADFGIPNKAEYYVSSAKKEQFRTKMKQVSLARTHSKKPVAMLDSDTREIIKQFESLTEAAKYFDTHLSNIQRALVGRRKTAMGYCWSYIK